MNKAQLEKQLIAYIQEDDLSNLSEYLGEFETIPLNVPDMENADATADGHESLNEIMGLNEIDGAGFVGVYFGGDWEWPVYGIVLWDEVKGKPTIHVIKEGNVYDWDNECPYENMDDVDDEDDEVNAKPSDLGYKPELLIASAKKMLKEINMESPVEKGGAEIFGA